MPQEPAANYTDDAPIVSHKDDRFARWAFADRVAKVIATRTDTSSLVIGIYGPWGDGKTSALNMMRESLSAAGDVVCISFNPWHFDSQAQLLRGFFDTLAAAAGKALSTGKEKFGQWLEEYGGLLSVATINIPGVSISAGDAATAAGKALSNAKLEELKDRLDKLLVESGKRIVILIDDIDRLDKAEIHVLLKLIKLSASFHNTAYVLAFDDEMVAASLGERYGRGDAEAGKHFLEKIIQVPLHLPDAELEDLRQLAFEGVDQVLKENEIALSREDVEAFVRHFSLGVLPALTTPRQVKRYVNAIRFAVPLLKGEVNVVDQLLIEGVRTAYPPLYVAVRENEDTYLGESERSQDRTGEARKAIVAKVDSDVAYLNPDQREAAKRVIQALFPRVEGAYRNVGYAGDFETKWTERKEIASDAYFRRYFQYSVPRRDIQDSEITELWRCATAAEAAGVDKVLGSLTERKAWGRGLDKLFMTSKEVSDTARATMAVALARKSSSIPAEQGMFASVASARSRAASLAMRLVRRIGDATERMVVTKKVMAEASLLSFATDVLPGLSFDNDDSRLDIGNRFTDAEIAQVGTVVAARVATEFQDGVDYEKYGSDFGRLLWIWKTYGSAEGLEQHCKAWFAKSPVEAIRFLKAFISRMWGLESGLSSEGDFQRHSYDAIAQLIGFESIRSAIDTLYGDKVATFTFDKAYELKGDERIACHFVAIDKHVQEEKAAAAKIAEAATLATSTTSSAAEESTALITDELTSAPSAPSPQAQTAKASAGKKKGKKKK